MTSHLSSVKSIQLRSACINSSNWKKDYCRCRTLLTYKGEHVKEGYQSLAVSITFQNKEKTFEKEDIEKALKSIKNRLNFTYKAEVRD